MELKKYLIFIAIFSFTKFLYADIIKPAQNLTAFDVVKIQLNALKNKKPSKLLQKIPKKTTLAINL